jgi:hypothetical protein
MGGRASCPLLLQLKLRRPLAGLMQRSNVLRSNAAGTAGLSPASDEPLLSEDRLLGLLQLRVKFINLVQVQLALLC